MLLLHSELHSQNLQVALFDEANKSMQIAKQAQADVLSPRTFEEAMEEYNSARKEYDKNGDLSTIMKSIAAANIKFQKTTDNTKVSSVMFSSVLSARRDALSAEAEQYVKEMWENAEEKMRDAAEKLEKGDANKAEKKQ